MRAGCVEARGRDEVSPVGGRGIVDEARRELPAGGLLLSDLVKRLEVRPIDKVGGEVGHLIYRPEDDLLAGVKQRLMFLPSLSPRFVLSIIMESPSFAVVNAASVLRLVSESSDSMSSSVFGNGTAGNT